MTALLEIHKLQAFYGASKALHDVSLSMEAGETLLLLGRNGAGKTTLMRAIMGLVPTRGDIVFKGERISNLKSHEIARRGAGLVPEDRRMFGRLTVAENLELGRKPGTDGGTAWDIERVVSMFPALKQLMSRRAGAISGGQQQMVAIARTLLGNPDLIFLDEPAEGLAPVIVDELAAQLEALRSEGLSMIISEQNLTFARTLANRAYVLESGSVRFSGTLEALDAKPDEWMNYIAF
jgi:branched-chain amino acid transport system ATP-binding protein